MNPEPDPIGERAEIIGLARTVLLGPLGDDETIPSRTGGHLPHRNSLAGGCAPRFDGGRTAGWCSHQRGR